MDKYKKIYSNKYYDKADGINEWKKPCLKFGDNFAAILYAHDINYLDCVKFFNINENGRDITSFTLEEQFNYLNQNKKRKPKNILEIGGGRGEVANFLTYHNYKITSIEFSEFANEWYKKTSLQFYNKPIPVKLLNVNIKDVDFIKIDVDSHEGFVISGAMNWLTENSPIVMIENKRVSHNRQNNMPEPDYLLRKCGYGYYGQIGKADFVYRKIAKR